MSALVAAALLSSSPADSLVPNPGDARNCSDFANWNEAEVWFETYQPQYGDIAHLDAGNDLIPCETLPGAPAGNSSPSSGAGYWMVEANGTVFGFGSALPLAPMVRDDVVAATGSPNGAYWLLTRTGTVITRATVHLGNASVGAGDQPSTIAARPDGSGYWVFTRRGAVHTFGTAQFYGDMTAVPLNGEIIASTVTPSGNGYWLVGSDGGIFSFGDAAFYGSTGGLALNEPVVGIAPDPDGAGYWLVSADGGMFAFEAPFRGSVPAVLAPGQTLNRAVVGALGYGDGYLMVASDGGIFAFSSQPFLGSLGATPPVNPIVAVAVRGDQGPIPHPGEILDLASWKVTLPVDTAHAGSPDEILQPELATFADPRHFFVNGDRNGVVFRAYANGATTGGSSYPRSELREMAGPGSQSFASWSSDSGTHTMVVREAITHLPGQKPEVVAAQIHDADDDVIMIRLEGHHLFVEHDGDNIGDLDPDYHLGTVYTARIEASGGHIRVFFNDVLKVDLARSGAGMYFKAGCYTQSSIAKGDAPTAYGEVQISQLAVSHTG